MKLSKKWLSSQILLLVIAGWVCGLATIHHMWLVPSIKAQTARQESSVAVRWVEQGLSGLASQRKELSRQCDGWAVSPMAGELFAQAGRTPASLPERQVQGLGPAGLIACDVAGRVIATSGWITQTSPAWPNPPWRAGDKLIGSPLFPPGWDSPQVSGLTAANGRICLFARSLVGSEKSPLGYVVLVRPVDWPLLQDLSAITGVNVVVTDSLAPGAGRSQSLDEVHHWSSGRGALSAEVTLKDALGRPIGRLQVDGSVLDINSSAERIRSGYVVQLLWLVGSALLTFTAVYLLFIRPLAILVRRLGEDGLTAKREKLSAGLFAETGILARKFAEVMEKIVVLSETDPLTGLTNRRKFQILLDHEFRLSQRHGTPLAAMMIDVDFFKKVNDTYGHQAGDEVLQMVAATIKEMVRKSDVCGRYGGEEFCVVLPRTSSSQAEILGERIREAIMARTVQHDGQAVSVTISMGVAAMPETACPRPEDLLNWADQSLYCAKRTGRNRIVLASQIEQLRASLDAAPPTPAAPPATAQLPPGQAPLAGPA